MNRDGTKRVRVQADVGGGYDGLIRILIDCERFGFKLRSVVAEGDEQEATLAMTLHLSVSASSGTVRSSELLSNPSF